MVNRPGNFPVYVKMPGEQNVKIFDIELLLKYLTKNFLKNFKKTIDKYPIVCYTIYRG